jgi:hypothetical protein
MLITNQSMSHNGAEFLAQLDRKSFLFPQNYRSHSPTTPRKSRPSKTGARAPSDGAPEVNGKRHVVLVGTYSGRTGGAAGAGAAWRGDSQGGGAGRAGDASGAG